MRFLFLSLVLLCTAVLRARADEAPALPGNLHYVRGKNLEETLAILAPLLAGKQACVLDLRYPVTTPESAASLQRAMNNRPPQTRLFVLVSPATPAEVAKVLEESAAPGLFTLGISGSKPAPTVAVKGGAAADRTAYEALGTGTPLSELISGRIEKDRFDEAALVNEFKSGNTSVEPPLAASPNKPAIPAGPAKDEDSTVTPTLVRDHVLQRAVNLQQALLALRR